MLGTLGLRYEDKIEKDDGSRSDATVGTTGSGMGTDDDDAEAEFNLKLKKAGKSRIANNAKTDRRKKKSKRVSDNFELGDGRGLRVRLLFAKA